MRKFLTFLLLCSLTMVARAAVGDYTVEPAEGEVSSLSSVKFIAEGAICWTEEVAVTEVQVYKGSEVVASGSELIGTWTRGYWDDAYEIVFDTELVDAGDYSVVVPAGFFNLGSWSETSSEITLNYTIGGGGGGSDDTVGSNGGDYLTPEIMGFDMDATGGQSISPYTGPSGAEYGAYCYVGSGSYDGDFNISSNKCFIWNNSSAGTLSKLIFEADERSTDSRTMSVRASNVAYDGTQKYSTFSSYGTEVGQVSFPGGGTVEISGDYEYFAVGFAGEWDSSNIRFKAIEVVWSTDGSEGGSGSTELPDGYTVVPVEGEVESLSVITLDTASGICEVYGDNGFYSDTKKAEFKVTNDDTGETVATLGSWEVLLDEVTYHTNLEIRLSNDVTAAGSYTVYIPDGAFEDIADYEYVVNPAIELHYTVTGTGSSEGGSGSHEYSISPAEGVVSSLQEFTFTCYSGFVGNDDDYSSYTGTVNIYKDGNVYATASEIEGDWDSNVSRDFDIYININFAEAIVEAGDYELVIPAGLFYWMNGEDLGAANEEIRFSYTVDGSADTGSSEGGSEGGSVGSNGGDYIAADNIGLTAGSSSNETVTFTGASGTVYEANARWVSNGGDYDDNINFYVSGYLKNTSSVGTLSKVIFEANGNDTGSSTIFYVRAANEPWDGSDFTSYGTEVAQVTVAYGGEFAIDGEYTYFACYGGASLTSYRFKSIEVVWSTGDDDEGGEEEGAIPAGYVLDPAHESYVETLSTIVISLASGSNLTLNSYDAVGVVLSKTGGQVGTVSFSDDYDDELQMGWCVATLSEPISDMGTYYVTFPAGVFYDWGEYESNPEFTATYYVTGSGDTGEYSFDPADGSTLSSLESFDVCHSVCICCAWDQNLIIYVTDESGNIVAYDDDCEDNWPDSYDDPCLSCTITLNTKIVAAGTYTISIPAGYFVVGENDLLSEALTVSYTIDGSEDTGDEGGDEGGEETGLSSISSVLENAAGIYSVDGQLRTTLTKGVNIVKMNDGSTKKVLMK